MTPDDYKAQDAAGLVPVAHASDGAGSIRVPAAHCISRSVRDSAALLDATAGPEAGDPYGAPGAHGFLAVLGADPAPLRIAIAVRSPLGTPVDAECTAAAQAAAHLCEGLGHLVEEAEPRFDAMAIKQAWRTIAVVNAAASVSAFGRAAGIDDPLSRLEPVNAAWLAEAPSISGIVYAEALAICRRAGRALGRFFALYDVILTPTTAELPPRLGALACRDADIEGFYDRFWQHGPFTTIFNATGSPAMSVPLGVSAVGLPIGVQFAAAFGAEGRLFALAGQLERSAPWAQRRPSVPPRPHQGA